MRYHTTRKPKAKPVPTISKCGCSRITSEGDKYDLHTTSKSDINKILK